MSISRQSIEERCVELIARAKQMPAASIRAESTFDELALDSLDKVTLAYDVEEAYDIRIPESSLASIRSVGDMVSGIEHAIAAKSAPAPDPA